MVLYSVTRFLRPDLLAGLGVQAVQPELRVEREDVLAVHRRHGARDGVVGTDNAGLLVAARSPCQSLRDRQWTPHSFFASS